MTNHTILVIGATGLLGRPVVHRLHADGYRVRVFSHTPDKARTMFGGRHEMAVGNVEDPATIERAIEGCDGVHVNLFGGSDPDLERRGTANVAAVAATARVQRLTYLSGATVSEANSWFAGTRAKLAAETAIRASGVPYTIFRAASFMDALPQYVRGTSANLVGTQPHAWHWVAADDYARMVSTAYRTPAAANKTLSVLGPEAMTTRDALTRYCRTVNPALRIRTMPLWVARVVATVFRVKDLADALPYIKYFETAQELGDPAEANALLGAPTTTLAAWSQSRRDAATQRH